MSDAALAIPPWRLGIAHLRDRLWSGEAAILLLLAVVLIVVLPPFAFLVQASLTVGTAAQSHIGFDNFISVLAHNGAALWTNTIIYALGSSSVAIGLGVSSAWLVARTDAPFRQTAMVAAFLSMAVPVIVKSIGWIMLLGPNSGLINVMLRVVVGGEEGPIQLYSLGGMIFVEGMLWMPVVFLLTLPVLGAMDPSLEEAAATSGADLRHTFQRVTLPLMRPSIFAVFLLAFIRALESFEVPLLIGAPGDLQTLTTAIYQSMHTGFLPKYGEASAFAVLLLGVVVVPLAYYYRLTKQADRFATITGKGFRPRRLKLGLWRMPLGLWLLSIPLSLAAPVLIMVWASLLPVYKPPQFSDFAQLSFANYRSVWGRGDTLAGFANSALIGFWSATIVVTLTFTAAWLIVRYRSTARWALDVMISMPLVFPGIVLGITILIEFLALPTIPIYGTIWILIFAFLIRFMPYGMRFCHAGILAIHRELEECGRTCGASALTVLRRIVLPLALPSVAAAWLYVFLHSVRDLSLAVLLAGPGSQVIASVILDLWNNGEVPELAALAVVLAIGVTALGVVLMWLSRRTGSVAS
ncbi:MAG TPA: iron ABC transporter permease [Xanthobacteraceae bacterium]|nr:iron ABC transporter permease [Xanthobacteraceae bacterium]